MPPAPQFPLPSAVRLTNVEPGGSAAGEAGAVLRVISAATASLTGDDAGLFRISGMETLQIVKDPDAPGRAWETVSEAGVTVPATCSATVPAADYALTALFQPGSTAASAADTREVRVPEHRAATVTSGFAPQLTLFHPSKTSGTLAVSVNSDDPATVLFEIAGIPDTVSLALPQSVTVIRGTTVPATIDVSSSLTGFTDAFAPITIAWQIPADDFHPEEVRGSLVLSEVSLPIQVLTVPSGDLSDDTVSGSATLVIQQDGSVNFRGHVHDSGFFGGNYLVAILFPDVLDDQGRAVTFAHSDNIAGTIGGGDSRDDDWDVSGRANRP